VVEKLVPSFNEPIEFGIPQDSIVVCYCLFAGNHVVYYTPQRQQVIDIIGVNFWSSRTWWTPCRHSWQVGPIGRGAIVASFVRKAANTQAQECRVWSLRRPP
jgi:hypothetical protein